jgi:uncharacterized protein YfdQ (DUF2303 family)
VTEEIGANTAEIIERLTREGTLEPYELGDNHVRLVRPRDTIVDTVDLEPFLGAPLRTRGTVNLHTKESFGHFVKEHREDPRTHLYANAETFTYTAVFNDAGVDHPMATPVDFASPTPYLGWGDHRAVLALKKTREWLHWEKNDGRLMPQVEFAEHIEQGEPEIIEPSGAMVLELAQTFHVTTGAEFSSATILDSGSTSLSYTEQASATAGAKRDLVIPKQIKLSLQPFEVEGAQALTISARLRYRISSGKLQLSYTLIRPEDGLRLAFDDTTTWLADDVGLYPLRAAAPASPHST